MKKILIPVAAGALFFSTAAIAATGEYGNMCAMGLALEQKVDTDCSVNELIGGKTYCFGNEEARTAFMKDASGNLAKANSFYNDNQ